MPPGFMNAIFAAPKPAGAVASSCESAITSPSADSPAGVAARVIAALVEPITRPAIGAGSVRYSSTIARLRRSPWRRRG